MRFPPHPEVRARQREASKDGRRRSRPPPGIVRCGIPIKALARHNHLLRSTGPDFPEAAGEMTVQFQSETVARNAGGLAAALPLLKARFGDRFSDAAAVRAQHGQQTVWLKSEPPDAVIYPLTTEEVAEAVKICAAHKRAGHSVWRRHVAGRSCQRALRRRVVRPVAHEQDRRGTCGGSRLRRRAGGDAEAAERAPAFRQGCSSRSTPAPTPPSAAWRRRARPAPMRCATARCATTS